MCLHGLLVAPVAPFFGNICLQGPVMPVSAPKRRSCGIMYWQAPKIYSIWSHDWSIVRICPFSAILNILKKHLTLGGCSTQTTWPARVYGVSAERSCPYLSFGTLWYFVWPLVWSQSLLERVASSYPPSKCSFLTWVIKLSLVQYSNHEFEWMVEYVR